MISHRLSTVRNADEIVVLNKGRVVESGTHDELMAARGHYSRFHDAQTTRTRREVLA
jgi:ATP-binding cassette subfamily B protein